MFLTEKGADALPYVSLSTIGAVWIMAVPQALKHHYININQERRWRQQFTRF